MRISSGTLFRNFSSQDNFSFYFGGSFSTCSGISNIGFSGSDGKLNFLNFTSGNIFDFNNNCVYSYNPQDELTISGNILPNQINYFINNKLISISPKNNNFAYNIFYINTDRSEIDFNLQINGDIPNYNIVFPENINFGLPFTAHIVNEDSNKKFSIFSGFTFGQNYYNIVGNFNQLIEPQNSGALTFNYTNIFEDPNSFLTSVFSGFSGYLVLNTDFGSITNFFGLTIKDAPIYFINLTGIFTGTTGTVNDVFTPFGYDYNYELEIKNNTDPVYFRIEHVPVAGYDNSLYNFDYLSTGTVSGFLTGFIVGFDYIFGPLSGFAQSVGNVKNAFGNDIGGFVVIQNSPQLQYATGVISANYRVLLSGGSGFGIAPPGQTIPASGRVTLNFNNQEVFKSKIISGTAQVILTGFWGENIQLQNGISTLSKLVFFTGVTPINFAENLWRKDFGTKIGYNYTDPLPENPDYDNNFIYGPTGSINISFIPEDSGVIIFDALDNIKYYSANNTSGNLLKSVIPPDNFLNNSGVSFGTDIVDNNVFDLIGLPDSAWSTILEEDGGGGKIGHIGFRFENYQPQDLKTVSYYRINIDFSNNFRYIPYIFNLEGSNDSFNWTILDSRTGVNFYNASQQNIFKVQNPQFFTSIRINVISGIDISHREIDQVNDVNGLSISNIGFYSEEGVVTSNNAFRTLITNPFNKFFSKPSSTNDIGDYIYISNNFGTTFNRAAIGPKKWRKVVASDASRIVGITENDYAYLSNDNGNTWSIILNNIQNWQNVFISSNGNIICLVKNNEIYSSSNGGVSWTSRAFFQTEGLTNNSIYGFGASRNGQYQIVNAFEDFIYSFYFSNNFGSTWNKITGNISTIDSPNGVPLKNFAIANDGSFIFGCSESKDYIYKSTNLGLNWTAVSFTEFPATDPDDKKYISSINFSENRNSLVFAESGILENCQDPINSYNYCGSLFVNRITTPISNSFPVYNNWVIGSISNDSENLKDWVDVKVSQNGQHVVASNFMGSLYYSNNSGLNWSRLNSLNEKNYVSLHISPNGQNIIAAADSRLNAVFVSDFGDGFYNPISAFELDKNEFPYTSLIGAGRFQEQYFVGINTSETKDNFLTGYYIEFDSDDYKPDKLVIEYSTGNNIFQNLYTKNSNIDLIESGRFTTGVSGNSAIRFRFKDLIDGIAYQLPNYTCFSGWEKAFPESPSLNIQSSAVSLLGNVRVVTYDSDIITNNNNIFTGYVYISHDYGKNWFKSSYTGDSSANDENSVLKQVEMSHDGRYILIKPQGYCRNFYVSSNSGISFSKKMLADNFESYDMAMTQNGAVQCMVGNINFGSSSRIYYSENFGDTWTFRSSIQSNANGIFSRVFRSVKITSFTNNFNIFYIVIGVDDSDTGDTRIYLSNTSLLPGDLGTVSFSEAASFIDQGYDQNFTNFHVTAMNKTFFDEKELFIGRNQTLFRVSISNIINQEGNLGITEPGIVMNNQIKNISSPTFSEYMYVITLWIVTDSSLSQFTYENDTDSALLVSNNEYNSFDGDEFTNPFFGASTFINSTLSDPYYTTYSIDPFQTIVTNNTFYQNCDVGTHFIREPKEIRIKNLSIYQKQNSDLFYIKPTKFIGTGRLNGQISDIGSGIILNPTGSAWQPGVIFKTGTVAGVTDDFGIFSTTLNLLSTGSIGNIFAQNPIGYIQGSGTIEFLDSNGQGLVDNDIIVINNTSFSFISGTENAEAPFSFSSLDNFVDILNSGALGIYNTNSFNFQQDIGVTGIRVGNKINLFSYFPLGENSNQTRIGRICENINAIKIPNRYLQGGQTLLQSLDNSSGLFSNTETLTFENSGFYNVFRLLENQEFFINDVAWINNFNNNTKLYTGFNSNNLSVNPLNFATGISNVLGRLDAPDSISIQITKNNFPNINSNLSKLVIYTGNNFSNLNLYSENLLEG